MRFGTRRAWHPWGRPQLARRAWWGDRSVTYHAAASSYEEARGMLDARMDAEAAKCR